MSRDSESWPERGPLPDTRIVVKQPRCPSCGKAKADCWNNDSGKTLACGDGFHFGEIPAPRSDRVTPAPCKVCNDEGFVSDLGGVTLGVCDCVRADFKKAGLDYAKFSPVNGDFVTLATRDVMRLLASRASRGADAGTPSELPHDTDLRLITAYGDANTAFKANPKDEKAFLACMRATGELIRHFAALRDAAQADAQLIDAELGLLIEDAKRWGRASLGRAQNDSHRAMSAALDVDARRRRVIRLAAPPRTGD